MNLLILAFFTFFIAFVLAGAWRKSSLGRSLLDVPNARSSHDQPTPRGGGVAIVVAFCLGVVAFATRQPVSGREFSYAMIFSSGAVAGVGLMDDFGKVSVVTRFAAQMLCAIAAVIVLGGAPSVIILGRAWSLGMAGDVLAVFYLVWILNLYNFMDGIDGIAATEAVTVCGGACLILGMRDPALDIWPVSLILCMSCLGFLVWNFPKAKLFMGDVGSGFLGFAIGMLSLIAALSAPELLWSWLILLGVFIVDATITLAHRVFRRERFYQAHRSHGYQRAARKIGAHWPVTAMVAAINICWLFPLAFAVGLKHLDGLVGLLIAYGPLILIANRLGAGSRDS